MLYQQTDIVYLSHRKRNFNQGGESIFIQRREIREIGQISGMVNKLHQKGNVSDSFFNAIGPVLVMAQCFGIMPVSRIINSNANLVRFQWCCLRTLLAIFVILSGCLFGLATLRHIIHLGINAKNVVGIVFFFGCTLSFVLFLMLAKKWNLIMIYWHEKEKVFLDKRYTVNGWSLSSKIRITSAVVVIMAFTEHLLYIAASSYNYYIEAKFCNRVVDNWWSEYFNAQFYAVLKVIPYHFVTTFYLEYINFSLTFGWNYMDLFIMLISIGISTRFNQLNHRLSLMTDKVLPEEIWSETRNAYVLLCELVEFIDIHLSSIILLSCTNNLYFICFQLLNIFNKLPYLINKIYFWFSLLYLIIRAMVVYLCAASIHDASKKPLVTIRSIPSQGWCIELERFTEQVRNELIALSGSNFFYMTRKLLFGMAGTIVTYELVLLQFDQTNKSVGNYTVNCGDP